jgi:hypothetical protein
MFLYLKAHSHFHLVFYLILIDYSQEEYVEHNWEAFDGPVKEPWLPSALDPLGNAVQMTVFINSDHAGDKVM